MDLLSSLLYRILKIHCELRSVSKIIRNEIRTGDLTPRSSDGWRLLKLLGVGSSGYEGSVKKETRDSRLQPEKTKPAPQLSVAQALTEI